VAGVGYISTRFGRGARVRGLGYALSIWVTRSGGRKIINFHQPDKNSIKIKLSLVGLIWLTEDTFFHRLES
jgi:hypothetical protein